MDEQLMVRIIIGLLMVLLGLLSWNLRTHAADHQKLKDDHHSHKLNVSESYAKKSDLNAARMEINDSIRRLHEKIEEVDINLDKKISDIPDKVIRLFERSNR